MGNNANVGLNVNVKELVSNLAEDFKVSKDLQGNIQIYNLIEEHFLEQDEIQMMLQDLDLTKEQPKIRYFITDNEGKFVHGNSIKCISKDKYIYTPSDKLEVKYNSIQRAAEMLQRLEKSCYHAKLSHTFKIESMSVSTTMRYIIQDTLTGNYVSSDSVFVTRGEVLYSTHTGRADGLEYSNSIEVATEIANRVKTTLEKYHIHRSFKITEVIKENLPKGEMVIEHLSTKSVVSMAR